MQEKILVIEDDKNISKLIKYNLEKSNFNCFVAYTTDEAQNILDKNQIDLIILDIMLPDMDGFEFCKILKQEPKFKNIPIIMLTAKAEEIDRILGLELGADDYITKPFSPRELILRIKAILRRLKPKEQEKEILEIGPIKVDISRYKVFVDKKEIKLTPMEFKLLVTLIKRAGRVQTREQLLDDVWDINTEVYTRTVDTHIKRIRKKLGKFSKMIETIPGVGYRLKEEEKD